MRDLSGGLADLLVDLLVGLRAEDLARRFSRSPRSFGTAGSRTGSSIAAARTSSRSGPRSQRPRSGACAGTSCAGTSPPEATASRLCARRSSTLRPVRAPRRRARQALGRIAQVGLVTSLFSSHRDRQGAADPEDALYRPYRAAFAVGAKTCALSPPRSSLAPSGRAPSMPRRPCNGTAETRWHCGRF